ncbi:MAG TPA: glycosyltransferase, partial [Desertimonas sp.]|nr:glycosyltransferase [Desertimonas sp.]
NSAQYRVGELVISGVRSPRRLVRLPRDLWRLRKELLATHRVAPLAAATDRPARDIVAATILDEFSHLALAPEWDQRPLTTGPVGEQLTAIRPALLFVESVPTIPMVEAASAAARAQGTPSAFWNTEDPVRFDDFAAAAASFDWIFTTDADSVDRYVRMTGNNKVDVLPFAAQPRVHNPVGAPDARLPRAGFAGSWRADVTADFDLLLRPALDVGVLDIFDGMATPGATGARFPAPYDRAVLGARAYPHLLDEYRRYSWFLNVNSVKTSPTMCSRRVFELLACRTPVVSTPSRAIDELLGDAVITVDTQADAGAAVERLTTDPEHRDRVGQRGYRAVMSRHTYGHRVDHVLGKLGIAAPLRQPRVTVLAPTNRPEFLDPLLDNFTQQRDVDADLIVLTNSERFDRAEVDRRLAAIDGARAIHLAEGLTMGECLNVGLAATGARFIAKFDDDDHYGAYFLHDSLLVHRFVDAAIVGKKTFFAYLEGSDETIVRFPGNEFTAANRVSGSTMLIDRSVFPEVRFAALNLGEDIDLCEQAAQRGLVVFSADRYNYVAVRRRDAASHSWTISEADYRAGSVRVAAGLALDRTMV